MLNTGQPSSASSPPSSNTKSEPNQTDSSKQPPRKQGKIRSFLRRNFFDEENIGLNSAKEISQTWDTNINKITRFIEAKEHYIQYALACLAAIGGGFLYYKFKSLNFEKKFLLDRQKHSLVTDYLLKEAFTKGLSVNAKGVGLYREGVLNIKECRDYRKVWFDHFKEFKRPSADPLVLVGQSGVGKTELLRSIFVDIRRQRRLVAYANLELCRQDSLTLSDIILHENNSPDAALRKMMAEHSENSNKPVLLLDNVQLFSSLPNRFQILREIEYLRWSRTCDFLLASKSTWENIDSEGVLMSYKTIHFNGAADAQFYRQLVLKLNFNKEVREKVLSLQPNLYMLQQLYLTEDKESVLRKFGK